MKDKNDPGTLDWVKASALKNENGELQLPMQAQNLLKTIAIHCLAKGRDPVELIQDIHDATVFWLIDHDMRQNSDNVPPYSRGLN